MLNCQFTTALVFAAHEFVIPGELQGPTLALAHRGHQGIVKTKQLLCSKVWRPWIDKDDEKIISQCFPCQVQGPKTKPEPVHMSFMPTMFWHTLHIDVLCGPFPTGKDTSTALKEYRMNLERIWKRSRLAFNLQTFCCSMGWRAHSRFSHGVMYTVDLHCNEIINSYYNYWVSFSERS